jgi:hypothetical protein
VAHKHTFAGVGGNANPTIATSGVLLRKRHERPASRVTEKYYVFIASPAHLVGSGFDINHAQVVQTVGIVVEVASSEPKRRVSSGGEQGAGVVHREVTARMGENDCGLLFGNSRWRSPQNAANQSLIRSDDANRFTGYLNTGIIFG